MACFARKLRYGAHDGEGYGFYFSLIELAKKKGGRPVGFVLYRRIIEYSHPQGNKTEMIRLNARTADEAVKRFWPSDAKGAGKEFPGHKSKRWEKTTFWLDFVAAGGGYERFGYENHYARGIRLGGWAKVGTPAPWAKRRKRKKPLQIGNLGHILLTHHARLRPLEYERSSLSQKLLSLETIDEDNGSYVSEDDWDEYELVSAEMQRIEDEIDLIYGDIARIKAEMRYKVRRLFPKPMGLIPKRVLRYELERRQMGM